MGEDRFQDLLSVTIRHLEGLRDQGWRSVPLDPTLLTDLARPLRPKPISQQAAGVALSSSTDSSDLSTQSMPRLTRASGKNSPQKSLPRQVTLPAPSAKNPGPGGFSPPPEGCPPRTPPSDPAAHLAAHEALRQRTLRCTRCPHLVQSRTQVVFGVGNPNAELFFVGEAPGADEDLQGEPFVGKAGQLLTKMILAMGLQRDDVYIGNILKCRPDTPGQSSGNRKPTSQEMETCISHLHEQIDLIRPRVLVALGATAIEGLLGKSTIGITRLRGQWTAYRGIPLMPTYHPAYVLRNQAITVKRQVWEDLLAVMDRLGLPISAKQQGYFLKAS